MGLRMFLLAIIPISLAATMARAEPVSDQTNLIAQLEPMIETCDWKIRTLTGGPKGVMLLHNFKMKKILGELKAGNSVDPKEIDEVINMHALEGGRYLSH